MLVTVIGSMKVVVVEGSVEVLMGAVVVNSLK